MTCDRIAKGSAKIHLSDTKTPSRRGKVIWIAVWPWCIPSHCSHSESRTRESSALGIPTALSFDRCPMAFTDGAYDVWQAHQAVPGVAACLFNRGVGVPHRVRQLIAAQIRPDVFDRIQLGRVGRQRQHHDVVWHEDRKSVV